MLYLIGLGLDNGELSLNGLKALKNSKKLFLETYTTPISEEYLSFLKKQDIELILLNRSDLEENAKTLISKAKAEDIAILVPGDPLIATTHHLLLVIAKNLGVKVTIFHSSSIFSAAIAESGLDIYKFGPTTTITQWSKNYTPTSFLENIDRNLQNKQHTLLLFDIINNGERTLSIKEAASIITKAEEKLGKIIISKKKILLLENIGSKESSITYAELSVLSEKKNKKEIKKSCLIVPAQTSFAEKELLELFI